MGGIYDAVPLERGTSANIRVIELFDRDEADLEGLISCKFRTISLDDAPLYTALSYTWGSPGILKTILLNGKPFAVRANLWDFLHQACTRGNERPSLLWVDAICIDQSQVEEKNHQVAMMGEIYSRAAYVLVWLGPANPTLAKLLYEVSQSQMNGDSERMWLTGFGEQERLDMRDGFKQLCRKAYWRRIWVVQEFVLAKEVEIWCGTHISSIQQLKWLVYEKYSWEPLENDSVMVILNKRENRRYSRACSTRAFQELLDNFGLHMECQDIRDRVYALLSLQNPKEGSKISLKPNYALSVVELFEELFSVLYRSLSDDFQSLTVLEDTMLSLRRVLRLAEDERVVQNALLDIRARFDELRGPSHYYMYDSGDEDEAEIR